MMVEQKTARWFKENWFKIGVLLMLIVVVAGVSVYFYGQYRLEQQAQQNQVAQAAQQRADAQKQNCLATYEAESKKYNNVDTWSYNATYDECEITYTASTPDSAAVCGKDYSIALEWASTAQAKWDAGEDEAACLNGDFINRF